MVWHARLNLNYRLEAGRSVARHLHNGPLRILQSLYPEGDGICHNVLVHPPGGLVGGDTLDLNIEVGSGAHGLVTTPGATRFYRSEGPWATQTTRIALQADARMEWLPLEAICYDACLARNQLRLDLAPGAELMGWDTTVLGLPMANLPFTQGQFAQHIEIPGVWLERGLIAAQDSRLLDSPAGMAGQRCLATLFFACGNPLPRERREALLESARACLPGHELASMAGVTSPHPQLVVLRALAPHAEPAMQLLRAVRRVWRTRQWDLPATDPRIWAM
ncbi:urease accessory protein UreD [uncultured Rhodoferax sp.]|uniref:urease accessory protein UreD n=1 Tax=uncultured Rhodoferax sp. TaxID=223188 RepID=UPI0025E1D155|nr:urease accessory protein UreD [uncultured Rhodoferax sp.]